MTTPVTADAQTIGGVINQTLDGNDLTQATAANEPRWDTAEIGGRAAAFFDNTDDSLALDSALTLGDFVAMFVIKLDALSLEGMISNSGGTHYIRVQSSTVIRCFFGVAQLDLTVTTLVVDTPTLITVTRNSTTARVRQNGVEENSGSVSGTFSPINVGASNAFGGHFGEIVVYDQFHNDAALSKLEGQLMTKWGI